MAKMARIKRFEDEIGLTVVVRQVMNGRMIVIKGVKHDSIPQAE
jgi:hypothetical protein